MKKQLLIAIIVLHTTISNAQWLPTNGPFGGSISCIAMSGTNIFAGTYRSGIFLSTNNGNSWSPISNGLTVNGISSLVISGTNIFAGSSGGAGVYLSTNNGSTWVPVNNGLTFNDVRSVVVSGTNIYAGTYGAGIFLSTNNGSSWTNISPAYSVSSLAVNGANIFAGTINGVFLSTDNGNTWSATTLTSTNVQTFAISGSNIFAGGGGVNLSTDNGTTWIPVNTGLNINHYVLSLIMNGTNIFAGTDAGVFLSTNNGGNWSLLNTGLTNTYVTSLAISGSNIFAGTDGAGIFLSTNNANSWTAINNGITGWGRSSLAVSGNNIFAETQFGGVFLSTNNGGLWTAVDSGLTSPNVSLGDLNLSSISAFDNSIFVGSQNGNVFLSTDNGVSWTDVSFGGTYISSFAMSGTNIYTCTNGDGVYLSTDGGLTWTSTNSGLTSYYTSSLVVNGNNIFVGTGAGVFLSTNNGNSWSAVNNGLTNTIVTSLAISGNNIFAGTSGGGVFLSTNNGNNWTAINTGLSNTNINSFAITGNNIFVGTDGGIFLSTNNGGAWTSVNTGLTSLGISSLVLGGTNIFAGIQSAGMWIRPLSDMIADITVWPGDADNDRLINNNDLLPIGLYYGLTGTARTSINNIWQADTAVNWGTIQANGFDIKHADCNGDGTINSNDTLAINLNFNLTHMIPTIINNQQRQAASDMYFVTNKNSYQASEWVDVELWLGTSTAQVTNLYGISFNIYYDASLVQPNTESIVYPNSWLGTNGTDAIKISKIDALAVSAYGAKIRTDHVNVNGYGKIADFKFQIKSNATPFSSLNLNISSYKAVDAAGNLKTFNVIPLTIGVAVGIDELKNSNKIVIYPNPSNGQFKFIDLEKENTIEIYDITGRLIYQTITKDNIQTVDLSSKDKGLYLYKVINAKQEVQQGKIIIE